MQERADELDLYSSSTTVFIYQSSALAVVVVIPYAVCVGTYLSIHR